MNWEQIAGMTLVLLVMLVGLAGSILPALPSTPLVLVAAIAHRLYFGDTGASNIMLVILAALTAISLWLDFVASVLGARKFGATWRGMCGAVIGGIVGLFFSLPGIIAGPFLGATLFEMLGDKELHKAARAGVGAVLGLILGVIGRFVICVIMIALFATNVITRSLDRQPEESTVAATLSKPLLVVANAQPQPRHHRLVPQTDQLHQAGQPRQHAILQRV
jgi:uncharacterized protein